MRAGTHARRVPLDSTTQRSCNVLTVLWLDEVANCASARHSPQTGSTSPLHEETVMKFKRKSEAAKEQHLTNWHTIFALWPRPVSSTELRWLEYVERKGTYYPGDEYGEGGYMWEYRAK